MAAQSYDRLEGVIWYDGKLVPWDDANLHVLSHGLHYASAVFEGERAYGGKIFKTTEHSERLKRSAKILDFEIPYSVAEIDAAKKLVRRQERQEGSLCPPDRLARLGNDGRLGAEQHDPSRHRQLGMAELFRSRAAAQGHPARSRRLSPARSEDRALPRQGRRPLHDLHHLQACRRTQRLCRRHDAGLEGRVAECTGANIFFVKDGKIHTPIADCFLDGITRQTVIGLARKRGFEVIERRIMPDELSRSPSASSPARRRKSPRCRRSRQLEFQSRRHHQAADGRLHRRSEAEGQSRGGVTSIPSL